MHLNAKLLRNAFSSRSSLVLNIEGENTKSQDTVLTWILNYTLSGKKEQVLENLLDIIRRMVRSFSLFHNLDLKQIWSRDVEKGTKMKNVVRCNLANHWAPFSLLTSDNLFTIVYSAVSQFASKLLLDLDIQFYSISCTARMLRKILLHTLKLK